MTCSTNSRLCAITDRSCVQWALAESGDFCFFNNVQNQMIELGGVGIRVYKMLGIQEQGSLTSDQLSGSAMSGGDAPGYSAANAFQNNAHEWHSLQVGQTAVLAGAYLGIDCGVQKLPNGRARYVHDLGAIRMHPTALIIKQSSHVPKRVTKARVERSDDGRKWYGVAIVALPDTDSAETVHFKSSVPSRYWRLKPLEFNGGPTDYWSVVALQLSEHKSPEVQQIQDLIFMENRDRDYSTSPIDVKAMYELQDQMFELLKFGGGIPSLRYTVKVNFSNIISKLGRPVVIGDIIELPTEAQYSASMKMISKFVEVTNVVWDTESVTPQWLPTTLKITCEPLLASQETRAIFGGSINNVVDKSGIFGSNADIPVPFQDLQQVTDTIIANHKMAVPERGGEQSNVVREFTDEELATADAGGYTGLHHLQPNSKAIYVEDALPPNGALYTVGEHFPETPLDGAYHRVEYTGTADGVPARLYRYSTKKGRWVYLETDRRLATNSDKPIVTEMTTNNQGLMPARFIR